MKRIWVVFLKEVTDNLRDRRSISSALLTPLFTPLFLLGMMIVMGQTIFADPQEKPLALPVVGAEYAPGMMEYFKEYNVIISQGPPDPEAAVRNGDADVVLVILPDYAEKFQAGQPAPVQLVMDSSRSSALGSLERAQTLLRQYTGTIATLRLQARGVDPLVTAPLALANIDLATPQSQAIIFLNMMPFFLILVVFTGAMYVIIDTTAGERERGSLEPLLINPATRAEFAIGKLLAALPFAIVTLIISLTAFGAMFNLFPLEDYLNIPMRLDQAVLVAIFWLMLPIVLLATAINMVVASFTRSFKEAQTYLGFLPLIAGLPSAFLAFLPVRSSPALSLIPTFGQSLLINQLLRGETVQPLNMLLATLGTTVVALICTGIAVRLYYREQILYGR